MLKILHIEDNDGDARLIEEMLKEEGNREYEIVHVVRIKDAIKILKNDSSIDVILSDIALPDSQGEETFQRLNKVSVNLPVVFITGTHDESLAAQALQKGAQDYLLKGFFDRETLTRSIRYSIERKKFQKEATLAKSKARKLRQKTRLLKQKSEQLAELNIAKDDFISLASHQLRTPATGVKQYIGMILQGYTGEEISEKHKSLLQIAYESNERQLTIVDDLLKVAQLDSGRIKLRIKQIDLIKLLNDVINEQADSFAEKHIKITFNAPRKKIIIRADPDRIRMVFENIIDNARKYTQRGKTVNVEVKLGSETTNISIEDQGVGIDKKDVGKVFEKFTRINNSLSNTVGGTGLGLYWVKKVIDLHGGTILLQSEINRGSTFEVILPNKKAEV